MPPRVILPRITAREVLCNFQKLKPPKFEGGPDPLVYEDWIRKIEDLLEVMECPPQLKVRLASHQFEKEANFWWATVKHLAGQPQLTWQ